MVDKDNSSSDPYWVPVHEGPEWGFTGDSRPHKNNDDYTVEGVTGGTANVTDKPTAEKPTTAAKSTRS